MLVTLNEVLHDAQKKRYAVGLFNTVNLEMAQGVICAAEELRAPVIIGTAEILLPCASLEELAPLLSDMAKRAKVPVVLHFDHGLSIEKVRRAMDLGFSSVMYDCSALSFEENCRETAELTRAAHAAGITVEAELGHVGSAETPKGDQSIYTNPEDAAVFAERTQVDALAVAIGTAHGTYQKKPQLNIALLKQIAQMVETPLVLHGGSGLSEEDFQNCIQNGIAKVNIFTDINQAAAETAYTAYQKGIGMTELMPKIKMAVAEAAKEKMKIFGCAGRI